MNVVVVTNFDSMSAEVAKTVFAQIVRKPDSVLGLATGSTPRGIQSPGRVPCPGNGLQPPDHFQLG